MRWSTFPTLIAWPWFAVDCWQTPEGGLSPVAAEVAPMEVIGYHAPGEVPKQG